MAGFRMRSSLFISNFKNLPLALLMAFAAILIIELLQGSESWLLALFD